MSRFTLSLLKSSFVLCAVLSFSGCFDRASTPAPPEANSSARFRAGMFRGHAPLPTKDDLVLVNGRPLTLTDYFNIRHRVGESVPRDTVLWIGEASILLQQQKEHSTDPTSAVLIAGYAQGLFGIDQVRQLLGPNPPSAAALFKDIEGHLSRAALQQNSALLAGLK